MYTFLRLKVTQYQSSFFPLQIIEATVHLSDFLPIPHQKIQIADIAFPILIKMDINVLDLKRKRIGKKRHLSGFAAWRNWSEVGLVVEVVAIVEWFSDAFFGGELGVHSLDYGLMVFAELRESEVFRQEGVVQRVVRFVWDI